MTQRLLKLKYQAIKSQYESDLIQEKTHAYLMTPSYPDPEQERRQQPWLNHDSVKDYQYIANQARKEMMALYVECAASQMRQAAMDFDQLWQKCVTSDTRLPSSVLYVVDQRFDLIHAKIARHYRYRTELFRHDQKNMKKN